jgi:regulator of protease activity HflC (stomatin/prohibitin superfamily)
VLAFLLVALIVGLPALWLGGPAVGYFAFLLFGLLFVLFFSGDRRRLYAIAYSFLAVCLLFGGLAYARLVSQDTAARIGSLPLIGGLLRLTAVRVGMAVLAGLTGGLLLVGLPLFLILFISAEWMLALREAYDLDRQLAMKLLLDLALGRSGPLVIADAGEIKSTDSGGQLDKFGAPVVVLVKPYNALVLERGGEVTRIEGAGMVKLQQHETVKAVVDLRPQGGKFELTALTKDNVPLTVSGSTSFRIESWQEARDRGDEGDLETRGFTGVISGPYPVYRRTLYRAIYGVGSGADWKSQSVGNARGKIGAAIRDLLLDEIFVVDEDERVSMERSVLQDIVDQARPKAVKSGHSWGVTVKGVGIGSIEMPKEAQEEFLRRWGALWRGWRALVEAEAKRRAAVTEARSEQEAIRLQADAKKWKVITEAQAKSEAAAHESEAAVRKAQAESDARRIQARAEAEAEALFFEYMTRALDKALGREKAIEILKALADQRTSLDQLRQTLRLSGLAVWRPSLPGGRQRGLNLEGEEEMPEETE